MHTIIKPSLLVKLLTLDLLIYGTSFSAWCLLSSVLTEYIPDSIVPESHSLDGEHNAVVVGVAWCAT